MRIQDTKAQRLNTLTSLALTVSGSPNNLLVSNTAEQFLQENETASSNEVKERKKLFQWDGLK